VRPGLPRDNASDTGRRHRPTGRWIDLSGAGCCRFAARGGRFGDGRRRGGRL